MLTAPATALPDTADKMIDDDSAWIAVTARDRRADGTFWFAVKTTGVYCSPSCGARTPNRRNVTFFASPGAARAAGYRACRRCRPDETPDQRVAVQAVTTAVRAIEAAVAAGEKPPGLDCLARRAGYSPYHFHRLFRAETGVTPREFAAGLKATRAKAALGEEPRITDAIYAAGYSSPSRFYAAAGERLGMTPGAAQRGAAGEDIRYVIGQSTLGRVLVAATQRGVCAVLLGDDAADLLADLRRRFPKATLSEGGDAGRARLDDVVAAIETPGGNPHLPLDIRGTAFQEQVWQALRRIPPGSTATYAEIAAALGRPSAARAVAQACAANPAAVIVPCHRVLRAGGGLSGYRWGVGRKAELLRREAARSRR